MSEETGKKKKSTVNHMDDEDILVGEVMDEDASEEESDFDANGEDRGRRRGERRMSKEKFSERAGKWDKRDVNRGIILTISLCIVIVFMSLIGKVPDVFGFILKFLSALTPFLIGCGIAFLLNPVVKAIKKPMRKLTRRMCKTNAKAESMANVFSVILTVIIFIAFLIFILSIMLPQLKDSIVKLYNNIPTYMKNVKEWLGGMFKDNQQVMDVISKYLDNFQDTMSKLLSDNLIPNMDTILLKVTSGLVDVFGIVIDLFVGIIVSIYVLLDKENLKAKCKKVIYSTVKKQSGNKILDALEYVNRVFGGFINGKVVDSLVIGILTGLFCWLVGMPYGVLVAVIIGVTNIIPFFGPFIGAVPSALLILVEDPKMALIFIIFILVLQQLDANIVQPVVLGESTGLSGLGVLIAIMVGSSMFGIVGMILAVPVFAILYTILTILLRNRLHSKGFTNDTAYYINLYGFDEAGNPIRGERVKKKEEKKYHYLLGFLNNKKDKQKLLEPPKEENPQNEEKAPGVFEYRPIEDDYTVIEESEDGQDDQDKPVVQKPKAQRPKRQNKTGGRQKTEKKDENKEEK